MPPRAVWTICFTRRIQGNLPYPAMNFDRLVQSLYMTAAVQMGAGSAPNEQPRIDILGARQSIDMLSVLDEKTKGNLRSRKSGCCRMRFSICACRFSRSRMPLPVLPSGRRKRANPTRPRECLHPSSRDHHSWQRHLDGCADPWLQLPGLHLCRPARSPHPSVDRRHLGRTSGADRHRAGLSYAGPARGHRSCGRGALYPLPCRPHPGPGRFTAAQLQAREQDPACMPTMPRPT